MNTTLKMPEPIDLGQIYEFGLEQHLTHYQDHQRRLESGEGLITVTADRYACGYPIPPFQRPLVWTRAQEIAFIESIWLGFSIGGCCTHDIDWDLDENVKPYSGWLIDGQQRLTTLQRYWDDEFKVYGQYFSELSKKDRFRLLRTKFPQNIPKVNDEKIIKELYNRMAFGGTAHTPEQRAV
jgi:hypothetical protein